MQKDENEDHYDRTDSNADTYCLVPQALYSLLKLEFYPFEAVLDALLGFVWQSRIILHRLLLYQSS